MTKETSTETTHGTLPDTSTAVGDWQPIGTMPEGVRVDVRRGDCPGYDTTAVRNGSRIDCASWFVRSDMAMITRPTHWRPVRSRVSA